MPDDESSAPPAEAAPPRPPLTVTRYGPPPSSPTPWSTDLPGQVGEAHWNEEANALIAGLILHVVCNEASEIRTLSTVRELLTSSPKEFRTLLEIMQKTARAGGLVRRVRDRHLGKSEREACGALSSAQRHTHFLD